MRSIQTLHRTAAAVADPGFQGHRPPAVAERRRWALTFRRPGRISMRLAIATLLFGLGMAAPFHVAQAGGSPSEDEFAVLLERLRKESPDEYDKVVKLAKTE